MNHPTPSSLEQLAARVCVVIVNWNSWHLLDKCLDALAAQTIQGFQVLVVDNASTQAEPPGFWSKYPQVKVHRSENNVGFAAANNLALRAAVDVDWIATLNPDAFAKPDWLSKLLTATIQFPEIAAFGSRQLQYENPTLLDGDGDVYHISGLIWRDGFGKPAADALQTPHEIFAPCAAAALYRRDALFAIDGFDEDFFCYAEDVDLGFRLRLQGRRCLLVPAAVVSHVGSACTGGQQSDFAVYHGHRNLVWCFVKNMPAVLFWPLLPVHLAMTLLVIGVFTWRGRAAVILKAKADAIKGLPAMWRKRRSSEATRSVAMWQLWRVLHKSNR